MAANERDSTGEWLLPEGGGPPTLYELERRVEVALSVAHAAETAALEIGAASIEAAEQARRAAELAERASAAALVRGPEPANGSGEVDFPAPPASAVDPDPVPVYGRDEGLQHFLSRAEEVSVRLRDMQPA